MKAEKDENRKEEEEGNKAYQLYSISSKILKNDDEVSATSNQENKCQVFYDHDKE